MKKIIIKILVWAIAIFGLYYLVSITMSNNGQFVQHYYYPTVSVNESKENNIYIKTLNINNLEFIGDKEVKSNLQSQLILWIDKLKVRKSFGLFDIMPYDTIKDDSRVLRVAYKDNKQRYSTNHKAIYIEYNDKLLQSISNTTGYGYKNNDVAVLKFYDDEEKTKYLGMIKIKI